MCASNIESVHKILVIFLLYGIPLTSITAINTLSDINAVTNILHSDSVILITNITCTTIYAGFEDITNLPWSTPL